MYPLMHENDIKHEEIGLRGLAPKVPKKLHEGRGCKSKFFVERVYKYKSKTKTKVENIDSEVNMFFVAMPFKLESRVTEIIYFAKKTLKLL